MRYRGQDQGISLLDPVRSHALLSSGQCRLPKGDLPGPFLLPGQAVPHWGERGPKKVHTVLRQPAQALATLFRALFLKAMERFRAQAPWAGKRANSTSKTSS
ncbi:hypothetical protein DFAR_1540040 [Desulfarculales bacterium]